MEYESPELVRNEPAITVEAASGDAAFASDWTGAVGTPAHHCPHRLRFQDLNANGRRQARISRLAIASSWMVIGFGLLLGLMLVTTGFTDGDQLAALVGLLLLCGMVLQSLGAVALALTWRRLHRPRNATIGAAAVGLLGVFVAAVLLFLFTELDAALLLTVPPAVVLWQLFQFRARLYDRETCRAYPWHAPAVRAMLEHDPSPYAVVPGPYRFRVKDCPHKLELRALRRRYQVLSIVNTLLLILYVAGQVILVADLFALNEFGGVWVGYDVMALALLPLIRIAYQEVAVRSRRYHRAPVWLSVGAFAAHGLTAAASVCAAVVLGDLLMLATAGLAAYGCYWTAVAMTRLPSRAECRSLREPPPIVQKMLKTAPTVAAPA